MTEYRAFDKKGLLVGLQEHDSIESALTWGAAVARNGAVKIEKKDGEHWVPVESFGGMRAASEGEGPGV